MEQLHTSADPCPNCGTATRPADIIRVDYDGQLLYVYFCTVCRGASWEATRWAPTPRTEAPKHD